MTNEMDNSIMGQVVAAFRVGGRDAANEVQNRLLNERSAQLADWMNGFAQIDKPYLAFIISASAMGLTEQLDRGERLIFDQLKLSFRSMFIMAPCEDPDHG